MRSSRPSIRKRRRRRKLLQKQSQMHRQKYLDLGWFEGFNDLRFVFSWIVDLTRASCRPWHESSSWPRQRPQGTLRPTSQAVTLQTHVPCPWTASAVFQEHLKKHLLRLRSKFFGNWHGLVVIDDCRAVEVRRGSISTRLFLGGDEWRSPEGRRMDLRQLELHWIAFLLDLLCLGLVRSATEFRRKKRQLLRWEEFSVGPRVPGRYVWLSDLSEFGSIEQQDLIVGRRPVGIVGYRPVNNGCSAGHQNHQRSLEESWGRHPCYSGLITGTQRSEMIWDRMIGLKESIWEHQLYIIIPTSMHIQFVTAVPHGILDRLRKKVWRGRRKIGRPSGSPSWGV